MSTKSTEEGAEQPTQSSFAEPHRFAPSSDRFAATFSLGGEKESYFAPAPFSMRREDGLPAMP